MKLGFTDKQSSTQATPAAQNRKWDEFLEEFENEIGRRQFQVFGTLLEFDHEENEKIIARVPKSFHKEWLTEKHGEALESCFSKIYTDQKILKIKIDNKDDSSLTEINDKQEEDLQNVKRSFPFARNTDLNPGYTFDNFVVGSTNEYAYTASRAVAEDPTSYNPLFIYGGVGLGKTHLLQAIGHKIKERWEQANVKYVSAEKFTNEIIQALMEKNQKEFKYRYRSTDLFLVDDIQFLAKTDRAQEEFFHTFNELYENGKGIVLCSDRPPHEISKIEERLRNRFEMGYTVDIKPPDYETRVAILQKKIQQSGIVVPQEVINIIASNVTSNIRVLEGCLNRLTVTASLSSEEITPELARQKLSDYMDENRQQPDKPITIQEIQEATCSQFDLSRNQLKSKKRTRAIAFPRQLAMHLCRELTNSSYADIGDEFGGRDHSTVIHASNKIEEKLEEEDSSVETQLRQLKNELYS
ncbi:MAG: chromosomal replication initiator protein DnaA [bacterium]